MEINLLRNVKKFRLYVVQFLIMALFAGSLLPQACFCGEACLHGLQVTAKTRQSYPIHNRCSESQCSSCNVEDVQTIKLSNATHASAKLKTLNTPLISSSCPDHQPEINFNRIFFLHLDKSLKVQFPPTYLQNCFLLL